MADHRKALAAGAGGAADHVFPRPVVIDHIEIDRGEFTHRVAQIACGGERLQEYLRQYDRGPV